MVRLTWRKCRGYLGQFREGNPSTFEWFEWLYDRLEEISRVVEDEPRARFCIATGAHEKGSDRGEGDRLLLLSNTCRRVRTTDRFPSRARSTACPARRSRCRRTKSVARPGSSSASTSCPCTTTPRSSRPICHRCSSTGGKAATGPGTRDSRRRLRELHGWDGARHVVPRLEVGRHHLRPRHALLGHRAPGP